MAYGEQSLSTRKVVSIALVIVLHAIIGYAFVTGLAYNVVKKVARDLKTFDVAEEAPPPPDQPPPPPPETKIEPPPIVAPPPIVQVQSVSPPIMPSVPVAPPIITPSAPSAPPPPAVSRAGKPRGNPAEWVTTEDYPSADLRAENQGVTSVEIQVGPEGRATDCRTTTSSGFPGLDTKACQMILRRARFTPQLNGDGQAMPFTWRQRVRWTIPKD